MDKLPDITLPVWMNRGEPLTLASASKTWWQRVYGWLTFPLAQIDVDTCDSQLLSLLAWQRDVTRIRHEPLALFRRRVKYAFVNAQDAGSRAGFERIFQRLEIGTLVQLERQFAADWDVIVLRIDDEQLTHNNVLMMNLVRQYGRTCRRYFFDVLNQHAVTVRPGEFSRLAGFHSAKYEG
ncbi:phage tail protein [Erwinia tracheiphila]|nr:phage tail protein [Erwinia tracheiphila]UIA82112.1 phage tail protein [Erwinia tracheiphila]UIA90708.1 phage tail protein [Erwinia tracheiphila]